MRLASYFIIAAAAIAALSLATFAGLIDNNIFLSESNKDSKERIQLATAASLPFEVNTHLEPQLKAGDAELGSGYLRIDPHWMDPEQHCEECTLVEYSPGPNGVAGIAYKNDKSLDFSGAKKVRFFAMGQEGGEKIRFKVGGSEVSDTKNKIDSLKQDKKGVFKNQKFALTTEEVTLKNDWDRYEISLEGSSLADILYPFALELSKQNSDKKVTFYIKGVVFDTENSANPLAISNDLQESIINNIPEATVDNNIIVSADQSPGESPGIDSSDNNSNIGAVETPAVQQVENTTQSVIPDMNLISLPDITNNSGGNVEAGTLLESKGPEEGKEKKKGQKGD